jgi:putative heme-binding domain-containing protein
MATGRRQQRRASAVFQGSLFTASFFNVSILLMMSVGTFFSRDQSESILSLVLLLVSFLAAHADAPAVAPPEAAQFLRFALTREGDARRGQDLFNSEQRLSCTRCHTVDGTAAKAGPDLFAIGDKFGRREIIESVLSPSTNIAVGYSTTIVETKTGDEYSGVIKQATPAELGLMGADALLVRIHTADILKRRTGEVSLMPEGLQEGLTLQEFTDVIEYLVSLKQPEHSDVAHHGMPDRIPLLGEPVKLHPIHGPDLRFEHPVWIGAVPGEVGVFLVAEHDSGKVWRLSYGSRHQKTLFLDTGVHDPGARGLLELAFHPQFSRNRRFYVAKQIVKDSQFVSVVYEHEAAPDLATDSGHPGRLILAFEGPTNVNHAGSLLFGSDGYLYVAMGDSGPPEDPQGHGQDPKVLLGKILRIDVDHAGPGPAYSIPRDNPFVGQAAFRPEIWAYGLREPWRCTFDALTGELWVGDVGQDRYEEIDIVRPGENFGWNVYEGFEPFSNRYRNEDAHYVRPVFAYRRPFGVCVTGGYVYRGNPNSSFYGVYIFGDYESRRMFGLTQDNRILKEVRQVGTSPERIASFGQDAAGELFIVGYEGTVSKLDFSSSVFR